MTPTVDFPTLRTQLLQVVDELPDAINPMRGGTCVYELVTPAGEVHNCVMGRWAVKFGHPIPDANESASAVFCGILTEKAQHFADTVQSLADEGRNPNRPQPLRWGDLRELIETHDPDHPDCRYHDDLSDYPG